MAKYIDIFDNTSQGAIKLLSKPIYDMALYHHSQGAGATTWISSFRQIKKRNPLAAQLLLFLSWIEPIGIPHGILPNQKSSRKLTNAIRILCDYRFLEKRAGDSIYDINKLVHLVMKTWSQQQEEERISKDILLRHLNRIFYTDKWERAEKFGVYIYHMYYKY